MKHFLLQIVCLMLMLSMVACGSKKDSQHGSEETTNQPDPGTSEETYPYYDGKDFEGYEFKILNYESYCGTTLQFAPLEQESGDIISNKMYARNDRVEKKLNVVITEDRKSYSDLGGWGGQANLGQLVYKSVHAGIFNWDIANLFLDWNPTLITEGKLVDLNTVPELHLDEDYWDGDIIKTLTLKGKSYAGSGKVTLMPIDLTWCVFFNEKMIDNLELESPYRLVDDHQWTLDKMFEYVKIATQLNGDAAFDFENNDRATCGIAAHTDAVSAVVFAAGNPFMKVNEEGEILANITTERIYTTIEKVNSMFSKSAGYSQLGVKQPNSDGSPTGYMGMFKSNRALFMTGEVKCASILRSEMESTYGVLPSPMFDEAQEKYYAQLGSPAMLTVPVLQEDISRTGLILDALSYESAEVMDTYYNQIVSNRNLSNPESVRMLNLIHDNLAVDFGFFYGFTRHYVDELRKAIRSEIVNPASLAEKEVDTIDMRVEKFLQSLEKDSAATE